jgi:hypothetical protein
MRPVGDSLMDDAAGFREMKQDERNRCHQQDEEKQNP